MRHTAKNPTYIERTNVSISIVIVTFNNRNEIVQCLHSLKAAVIPYSAQLIVVDNDSSDGTAKLLQTHTDDLRYSFNQVKIHLNSHNIGFTAAVNQGLRSCVGDYILLLNPDMILQQDTITVLLEWLRKRPLIGVVAPQLRFPDGRIQPSCRRFPKKLDLLTELLPDRLIRLLRINNWKIIEFDHANSREVDQPQGAFLLMCEQVLSQVGLLDEQFFMFFSDVDWCRRVKEKNWQIWFVADTFVYHKKGASVYKNRRAMLVSSHRSFIQYFSKYDHSIWQKSGTKIVSLFLLLVLVVRLVCAASIFHEHEVNE